MKPASEHALNHVLAIDIGNTRLKWALHNGTDWVAQGSRSTRDSMVPSMLVEEWAQLASHLAPHSPPHLPNLRAMISNVADKATTKVVISALRAIGCKESELVIAKPVQCDVRNGYAQPTQLGTDRWLALIAALDVAQSLGADEFLLLGDAATVINQANGIWKCRSPALQAHRARFEAKGGVRPAQIRKVSRSQNLAGIALAKLKM